jgi:hypothetical protein
MLQFLLTPNHVAILLWIFAALTPLAALGGWRLCKKRWRHYCKERWFKVAGAFGPLALALWYVFNGIEDRFGLDSVPALGLNLLIFCGIGIGISAYLRKVR